jgi:hypothetical protein
MAGSRPSFSVSENQPRNPSWQVHPDAGREWQPRDNPEVSPFGGRGRARARPKLGVGPRSPMAAARDDQRNPGCSLERQIYLLGSRSCRHASPPHSRHQAAGLGKDIPPGTRREHRNNPRLRVALSSRATPTVGPTSAPAQCIRPMHLPGRGPVAPARPSSPRANWQRIDVLTSAARCRDRPRCAAPAMSPRAEAAPRR